MVVRHRKGRRADERAEKVGARHRCGRVGLGADERVGESGVGRGGGGRDGVEEFVVDNVLQKSGRVPQLRQRRVGKVAWR